ncbi:hypothetical protein [Spiroplasma endosymbiont of Polydrusus pterygomalis]|uniref:hypothetical protein n=1 Tax=Spiroplasma endosymbiont of Polydrusus pterygomalis TaxID=3139327 RepID=UPI003CCA77A9
MSWIDKLRLLKIFKNFPLNKESLDAVIAVFEDLFEEYIEKDDFFSNSKPTTSQNIDASLPLMQLKEITKTNLDVLIKEIRNDLKYNFFTYFFQKKENLKLIKKLNELIIECNNKIKEQNQQLLFLEQNKLSINEQSKINNNNVVVTNIENYFDFFVSLNKRIINDVNFLEKMSLTVFENKKIFLKNTRELKNEIDQEVKKLSQKNRELENQSKKIFLKLFKEEIITQFILSFWAFRVKNNNHEYTINLEDKDLKGETNESIKGFSVSSKLIDDVYNKYLIKIIKNEEKIYTDIFKKFSVQKKNFESEQAETIQNKAKIEAKIEQLQKNIEEQKQKAIKFQAEVITKRTQIKNLEKRKKQIKTKKITYWQDQKLNKNNFEDQILIEDNLDSKNAKKQYLNKLEKLIDEKECYVKTKNSDITELEYDIIRDKTELDINNNRIKKIDEKNRKIQAVFQENKHRMLSELQKIKEKWIKKIDKNQKEFIDFLNKFNKLEDEKFIKCLEECWIINENEILLFNEEFNIKNNLQVMKQQSEKIENDFKNNFEVLKVSFELEEKAIIKNANEEIIKNSRKFLMETSQLKIKTAETQTEINGKEGKTSWSQQKIDEQAELEKQLKKCQDEKKDLENKLILIKEEHEEEVNDLSTRLENIGISLITKKKLTEEKCKELKNKFNSKLQKKEEQDLQNQLFEQEIKLLVENDICAEINKEIPISKSVSL